MSKKSSGGNGGFCQDIFYKIWQSSSHILTSIKYLLRERELWCLWSQKSWKWEEKRCGPPTSSESGPGVPVNHIDFRFLKSPLMHYYSNVLALACFGWYGLWLWRKHWTEEQYLFEFLKLQLHASFQPNNCLRKKTNIYLLWEIYYKYYLSP